MVGTGIWFMSSEVTSEARLATVLLGNIGESGLRPHIVGDKEADAGLQQQAIMLCCGAAFGNRRRLAYAYSESFEPSLEVGKLN